MAFASSFNYAYHFRLLYQSSALMYPIMGAMRYSIEDRVWRVYRREAPRKREESYELVREFDTQPEGQSLNECFKKKAAPPRDPSRPAWMDL